MSLERIRTMIECEPMLIDPVRVASLYRAILTPKADIWDDIDKDLEERGKRPQITVADGVAIVPVSGVLIAGTDTLDRARGYADLADIRRMVQEADGRKDVRSIFMPFDTPGGGVTATEETADVIMGASKPVLAWTGTLAASGGMWLASAANAFYVSKSATVGSIGVYMAFMDMSGLAEQMGIKVDVIKSTGTPFKAAGVPGTSLSDVQREQFQSQVDGIFARFKSQIQTRRKKAGPDTMRGQTFSGVEAVGNGLADSIATYETALRSARNIADLRGMKG